MKGKKEGNEKPEGNAEADAPSSAPVRENPFSKYVGAYPAFKSLKEINKWVRDMREDRFDWEN